MKSNVIQILFFLMLFSCSKNQKNKEEFNSISDIGFNNAIKKIIKEYNTNSMNFADKNGICLPTCIDISEMKNDTFNIVFQTIFTKEQFKTLEVDNYFLYKKNCYYINYGISEILYFKKKFNIKKIENKTKINNFLGGEDRNYPCWRALIYKNKILKLSKHALSNLKKDKIGVASVDKNGKIHHQTINEWGEIKDNEGKIYNFYESKIKMK